MFTDRLNDVAEIVAASSHPLYVVGQRTDIDQASPLDFDAGWQDRLVARAVERGERKPLQWIDYFMFPRGLFTDLPPFAIGRPGYDPWLIWRAADLGAQIVDATRFLPAIHQRHDYSHVGSREAAFSGVEAKRNAAIVDDWRHYHSIAYATVVIDEAGNLRPARQWKYRLARPRSYAAHGLRFLRPLRRRLLGERATRSRLRRSAPDGA
jgi:hypothetical protein